MNYFDMLPNDIQDYITEIKTKKEEKYLLISSLESDLLKLQDTIETTQTTENNIEIITTHLFMTKQILLVTLMTMVTL